MKSKLSLIASIFQLTIGVLVVLAFIVLGAGSKNMKKWIVTLILFIAFVVLGVIGNIDYKSNK